MIAKIDLKIETSNLWAYVFREIKNPLRKKKISFVLRSHRFHFMKK